MRAGFELLDHTADIFIRAWAGNLPDLLAQAAVALTSILVENLKTIQPSQSHSYTLTAETPEELLLFWLRELIFQFETQSLLFVRFDVLMKAPELSLPGQVSCLCTCLGEKIDGERHSICKEVKAVTRHGLKVNHSDGVFEAEFLLDV